MRGALKRNATISRLLQQTHNKKIADVFTDPVAGIHPRHNLNSQTQARDYLKFVPHFLRKASRAYNECLPRVSHASLIYIAADLSSQTITSSQPFDLVRTLRMAGYGMIVLGPSLHFWFNFMSKVFPKRDLITTLKKMAMGQTVYGPFMTVVFLSVNARLQGESVEEIIARLKRDLLPTLVSGVMYWPMCDFITFRFVPVHLQPLVSNSFSYIWTIYLTYMGSLEKAGTTPS
ncbi:PXMP2/4 family protein 4-like [Melia azedarach]|uniref:PXMP2/4 family protein 4-like n=1 Tax=Melia azedarach TaxID=155640 RepID=A0ACC1XXH6_MELAZ|nr:PXMP2/4 family protein 4-like [Melia azedarach]